MRSVFTTIADSAAFTWRVSSSTVARPASLKLSRSRHPSRVEEESWFQRQGERAASLGFPPGRLRHLRRRGGTHSFRSPASIIPMGHSIRGAFLLACSEQFLAT